MRDSLAGFLPSVNDLLAAVVIIFVYAVRMVEASHATAAPIWLSLMADFILPGLAGAWIWVMAMYAAYVALGEP